MGGKAVTICRVIGSPYKFHLDKVKMTNNHYCQIIKDLLANVIASEARQSVSREIATSEIPPRNDVG